MKKNKTTCCMLLFLSCLFSGCNPDSKESQRSKSSVSVSQDSSDQLQETFNEEDVPENAYMAEKLKPIRENFKRINSIKHWERIETKELSGTTEGGEVKYYYQNGQLERMITRQFGETFQQLAEYYLLGGQLSFVFEKSYKYNRPVYYDSNAMKENDDTEVFDFEKSNIIEDRSYFENDKLLHQLNNQDCGSPFTQDYLLEEEKRIKATYNGLLKRLKE